MRKKSALVLLAALSIAAAPNEPQHKVLPHATTVETLPNGLRVVLVPHDSPGLVAYYTLVRVGARDEVEPGHTGFAHFFEHMMFRGTKKYPAGAWETALSSRGADLNASTWTDHTLYEILAPTDALPTIVDMEADRFQNLTYAKEAFQTEAKAVLGEYWKNASNPSEKLEEVLLGTAFDKHTYRHTTIGFLDDVRAMPDRFEYSQKFFQRFYRPDNCVVFVVGDFDARTTFERIKAAYAPWSGKAEQVSVPNEPSQSGERRKHVPWPSVTKPLLMVAHKAPSLGEDISAAAVQTLLGPYLFADGSPLHRDLVLTRQLAESLRSQYMDTRDPKLFYWQATLKSEAAAAEVEAAVERELAALRAGRVDKARLEAVKSHLRYSMAMYLETPGRIAETLGLLAAPTGEPDSLNMLYARVATLTAKDVAAFARKHLVASGRTVVT